LVGTLEKDHGWSNHDPRHHSASLIGSSSPWRVFHEKDESIGCDISFTAKGNSVYVFCPSGQAGELTIKALGMEALPGQQIVSVGMLGCVEKIKWSQTASELTLTLRPASPGGLLSTYRFDLEPVRVNTPPPMKGHRKQGALKISMRRCHQFPTGLSITEKTNPLRWSATWTTARSRPTVAKSPATEFDMDQGGWASRPPVPSESTSERAVRSLAPHGLSAVIDTPLHVTPDFDCL